MTLIEPTQQRVRWHKACIEGEYGDSDELEEPTEAHPANLASSLCVDGLHRPALDVDIACELHPSTTPGHYHLYFPDLALSWDQYRVLLEALELAGILEPGYVSASVERGQTVLRLPGVLKPTPLPYCIGCCQYADAITSCQQAAVCGLEEETGMVTPGQVRDWVRQNEGTYNAKNGHFLCDECYIAAGQPSLPAPARWVAP